MNDLNDKCQTCQGTGYIKTEGCRFGRPYFCKEQKELVRDIHGDGVWIDTLCPDCCESEVN